MSQYGKPNGDFREVFHSQNVFRIEIHGVLLCVPHEKQRWEVIGTVYIIHIYANVLFLCGSCSI